jgi:hypothetical protein
MARHEEAAQVAAPTAETYEILADAWQRLGLRDEVMAETGTHGGYAPRRGAKYKERDRGSKVRYPPFNPPHPPDRKGACTLRRAVMCSLLQQTVVIGSNGAKKAPDSLVVRAAQTAPFPLTPVPWLSALPPMLDQVRVSGSAIATQHSPMPCLDSQATWARRRSGYTPLVGLGVFVPTRGATGASALLNPSKFASLG